MFSITGKLQKFFTQPGGKGKDGLEYPEVTKIQILGEMGLRNGETKLELLTLTVPPNRLKELKEQVGCDVVLPCGIFVSAGKLTPFLTV